MKRQNFLIAVLGALATSLAAANFAHAETVRVGIAAEPYPPFFIPLSTGGFTGWEMELVEAICAEAQLDCEVGTTAFDGLVPALASDKYDFIAASLSITDERKKVIDFSNKYYQTGAGLVTESGAGIVPNASGVAGKTIGVQSGSIHQAYAAKHFTNAEIREYQTMDDANQDLFAGRLDATFADALALEAFLLSDQGENCCELAGLVANDEAILGSGIGFGVQKGKADLLARLNTAIATVRANGVYDEISARYFSFNIYGE